MYNLLIADDEQIERDAIEFLIKKKNLPFNVIKAKNGKEAINIFENKEIDFVILDIKMPLVDGIEAGKNIRELNINIPIVYLTAWSTFDFAKSAIKIGALEYLVKPINKDDLYKLLSKFIEQKLFEKKTKNEELKTVINQFSRSFFASMKHGLINEDILKEYFNIKDSSYFEGVCLIVSEVNIDNLKNFFEQKGFFSSRFYYFPTSDRTTIIVFPNSKSNFFKQLKNNSSTKSYDITIAIGRVFSSLKELPKSIREASISYSIAQSNNEYIHEFNSQDEFFLKNDNSQYLNQIEKEIFDCNSKKAREIAHKLYDSLSLLDKHSMLESYYQDVLILKHTLSKKIPFFNYQKPQKNIVEIEIFLFNLIDNAIEALISDKRDRYERIFKEIMKEIEINYNRQITMDDYSNMLNMNTKYFSKLFKSYNNISFIDHLTNIRMEKAKILLIEGNSVKDTAINVGFLDSAYFSKVFNQKFDINPSLYKEAYENNETL